MKKTPTRKAARPKESHPPELPALTGDELGRIPDLDTQQLEALLSMKLLRCMRRVERIEKDARHPKQGWQYASEQAIKEELHPILAQELVLFRLEADHDRPPTVLKLQNDVLLLPVFYVFTDASTGFSVRAPWWGTGQARDEKGLYGCITGALKYALTTGLLIPTGDDPEADEAGPGPRPRPAGATQPPTRGPAPTNGGERPAEEKTYAPPPPDAGLRCMSCGHTAAAGSVKIQKAKRDGKRGQIMAGEPGYYCPGLVANPDKGEHDIECGLFQSVHGAGQNHVRSLKAKQPPTTEPEPGEPVIDAGADLLAQVKAKQNPIPGNCKSCGKATQTQDEHGDCVACALDVLRRTKP